MDDKKLKWIPIDLKPGDFVSQLDPVSLFQKKVSFYNYPYTKMSFSFKAASLVGLDLSIVDERSSSYAAWDKVVKSWKIEGKMPVELALLEHLARGDLFIKATIWTGDIRGGVTDVPVVATRGVPTNYPDGTANDFIRLLVRDLYLHELDEQIQIDGKRIYDPHGLAVSQLDFDD